LEWYWPALSIRCLSSSSGAKIVTGRELAKLASYVRVGIAFIEGGLVLDFGGHVIFRHGQWTSQAKKFLLGQRQLGGGRSNEWKRGRFIRRI